MVSSSARSLAMSASSLSRCELTDPYSPAAIDPAPATSAAAPAVNTPARLASAAATPTMSAAVEVMPSLAPSTAARSHPTRWLSWRSTWAAVDGMPSSNSRDDRSATEAGNTSRVQVSEHPIEGTRAGGARPLGYGVRHVEAGAAQGIAREGHVGAVRGGRSPGPSQLG